MEDILSLFLPSLRKYEKLVKKGLTLLALLAYTYHMKLIAMLAKKKARKTMEVKVTRMQCSGSYRSLSAMYEGVKNVFTSLPPLELLENYHPQQYSQWYEENFSDNPGNQGAALLVSLPATTNSEYHYSLATPTSGREVTLSFDKYSFLSLAVEFPGGSTNAALKLLSAYNLLDEKPTCEVTYEDADGKKYTTKNPATICVEQYTDDSISLDVVEA